MPRVTTPRARAARPYNDRTSLLVDSAGLVPVFDGLVGVFGELAMALAAGDRHPGSLGIQHDVGDLPGLRERRINGGSVRVDPLRPARIGDEERAAAALAEVAARRTVDAVAVVLDLRAVDAEIGAAAHF